jgi:hypothetical protein
MKKTILIIILVIKIQTFNALIDIILVKKINNLNNNNLVNK